MTIRDELDDARSAGYNDGFETGFNLALSQVQKLLEAVEDPVLQNSDAYLSLVNRIDQLSP